MSVLNPNSEEEAPECPLCMEFLELDDISFYPCACGYQICRFCWNKIRVEGSGNCPACRSPYSENPADFKPLTTEELARIKAEKRQKDQAKKQKISENRKHLANVRVVQKNLVFVVGLSPRLADPDVLKKAEYFGKFGKIHKVVINHSTAYAGNQNQVNGPSASAYVTYYKSEDALRAIQAVNNIFIDGRTLKASLGTTKYCSHFMKNQSCPKHDCMYLHELGDEAASFTKEEMQQGMHTDYERALHDEVSSIGNSNPSQKQAVTTGETGGGGGEARNGGGGQGNKTPTTNTNNTTGIGGSGVGGVLGKKSRSNSPRDSSTTTTSGWPNLNHRQQNGNKEESDEDLRTGTYRRMSDSTNKSKNGKRHQQHVPSPAAPQSASPPSLGSSVQTTASSSLGSGSGEVGGDLPSRPSPTPPIVEDFAKSEQDGRSNGMGVTKETEIDPASEVAMSTVNSVLPCDDDFDEDDLGFDPFHETQKGFADLLESETRQQQQQQQQRRVLHQQQDPLPLHHSFQAPGQVLLQPQAHQSNGRHSFLQATPSSSSQQALSRPKAPPPGFAAAGAGAATGVGGLPGLARFQSNGGIGIGGLDGLANHLPPTSPYSSSQDLLSRLGRGVSPPPGVQQHGRQQQLFAQQQQSNSLMPHQQDGKDWQDGLRALLPPNVNLSFSNGGGGNGFQQGDATGGGANRTANPLRFHRDEQDRRFNTVMGNPDLTLLDPAIVRSGGPGVMPPSHGGLGGRADSPLSNNSWLPSSSGLDQHFPPSSSDIGSNGFGKSPLPAFAGLSLSASSSTSPSAHQRWNGTGTASDRVGRSDLGHGGPPPPPGFNLGRMPPHQPQSSFPNMNMGNSDGPPHHQIENKGFF